MDIALYISTILHEQDEVGVPGLGTFFKRDSEAHFDSSSRKFYPPGTLVAFRPEVSSDNVLVDYISKAKRISTASAEYFAEKFGREINKELQSAGSISLGDLGSLYRSDPGLRFEPGTTVFSPASFGLVPIPEPEYVSTEVQSEPIAQAPVQKEAESLVPETDEKTAFKAEPANHASLQVDVPQSEEPFREDTTSGQDKPKPPQDPSQRMPFSNIFDNSDLPEVPLDTDEGIEPSRVLADGDDEAPRKNWLKAIIAVIIVAGLTFAGFMMYRDKLNQLFENYGKPTTTTKKVVAPVIEPQTFADTITSADSIVEALKKQGLSAEKPLDTVNVTTDAKDIKAAYGVKSYDIVGPSFAKKSQAITYITNMHKKGIYAYVIEGLPGTRIKVGLGSFKDMQAAALELPRIQKDIYPGANILPIKNK